MSSSSLKGARPPAAASPRAGPGSGSGSGSAAPRHTRRRSAQSQAAFRQQLLDHAKTVFRDKGFRAVSIRTLTEAFGLSPMAFYGYFPTKQALLREIWTDFFRELLDRLLAAGAGRRSPLQVIEAHVDAYLAYWESHPDNYKMVYLSDLSEPGAAGGETISVADDPVAQQIAALTRERLLACAQGRPLPEKALRMLQDRLFVRALGFLHVTLAVGLYPVSDRVRLRRAVVQDIVDMARHGGEALA